MRTKSRCCSPLAPFSGLLTATWDPAGGLLNKAQIVSQDGVDGPKRQVMCGGKLMDCYPLILLNNDGYSHGGIPSLLHLLDAGVALLKDVFPEHIQSVSLPNVSSTKCLPTKRLLNKTSP
jgi:hypothetical protein